ncbi:hypothetical protein [Pelagicoccus mobilis]|uniref:Glutamine amidotransferase domain-containing protein n=1 Tax=Pelagicoccus mobilis TaxID=415221 RepID=A0A934RZ93_9BACT|nr:hypothetical protein [Pelagicoccus mobilis]MBK1877047.1 hypothetical protein [Pelagicoccus mobilis]
MIFSSGQIWPILLIAIALLLPLSWFAWSRHDLRQKLLPVAMRAIGVSLILFALADPLILEEQPATGANLVAILADDSTGLRITDPGDLIDRAEKSRKLLSGSSSTWQAQLANTFQLRKYRFDHSLHRIGDFNNLSFEGNYSELGHNLLKLHDRLDQKPLAGIVLFSDGNSTDVELSDEALSKLPPIYPVILGSQKQVPDLALGKITLEQSAFSDSPIVLEADIRQSLENQSQVKLQLNQLKPPSIEETAQTATIRLDEQILAVDARDQTTFEWQTEGGGTQFFKLDLRQANTETPQQEATLANNQRLLAIDKGKSEYRILYVTGRPNWEYKFLNRALSEDERLSMVGLIRVATKEPNFEFKGRAGENSNSLYRGFGREEENERYDEAVLIRMNTKDAKELVTGFPSEAEELFAYDAIVIDDLEADFFSFTQQTLVRDFVKKRGGGLLLLGGVNAFQDGGYANTPIAQSLPIYLSRAIETSPSRPPALWELTRNGWVEPWTRIRSVDSDERLRIQDMPQFFVYNKFERIKPGAEALVSIEVPGSENHPALVTRKFGSGRVAAFAVGDLWRWGLQDAGTQADLAQFWRQLSRWMVTDTPDQIQLDASKTNAREITLTAKAYDQDFNPVQLGQALVNIKNLSSRDFDRKVEMKAIPEKPGTFTTRIAIRDEGAYLAEVSVANAEGELVGSAETGWVTQPLVDEFAATTPNLAYLQRIADATGGKLLNPSDLSKLEQLISERPSPLMETKSIHAWHNNWLYLLALGALLAEWLLRRKRGLA